MARTGKIAALLVLVAMVLGPIATAQERVNIKDINGTVLKKVGRTVVIRNDDTGEIKSYTKIPDDVEIYIDNKLATMDDLKEGMKLHALQFKNVYPPSVVTIEQVEAIKPAPAPKPKPVPAPAPAPEPEPEMPKTASPLPMIGLLGFLMLAAGVAMRRFSHEQ